MEKEMELRTLFKQIKELVNEGKLFFEGDSLKISVMDPANVAMVSLNYKLTNNKLKGNYFVNILNLYHILKNIEGTPEFSVDDDFLIIKKDNHEFKIRIIKDSEEKDQKEPTLIGTSTFSLHINTFRRILENADVVAESLAFTKKGFIADGDLSTYTFYHELPDDCKYSMEYLKRFLRILK